jgi:glutaredoxin-related protein
MEINVKVEVSRITQDEKEFKKFMRLKDKHNKLKNKIKQKKDELELLIENYKSLELYLDELLNN